MTQITKLVIERKTFGPEWEEFAHPKNDLDEARILLSNLRKDEESKRYKQPLRLVRKTFEYFEG